MEEDRRILVALERISQSIWSSKTRKKMMQKDHNSRDTMKNLEEFKIQNWTFFLFLFTIVGMQVNEQTVLINYINIICTPFSLAGALYMIYSYFRSCARSFSSKLVFCLALSDLLLSIVDVIEIISPNDQDCTVLGFLRVSGIYSNMLWTTQILSALYVQFVMEYTGVPRLFPYLVISNIMLSLAPSSLTLYDMYFGGELYFAEVNGECFMQP